MFLYYLRVVFLLYTIIVVHNQTLRGIGANLITV